MNKNFKLKTFENDFSSEANALIHSAFFFLSQDYLAALRGSLPTNISVHLAEFYEDETCVGVAILQEIHFNHGDAFPKSKNFNCFLKNFLNKIVRLKVLFLGNNMLTGQHSFYFKPEISQTQTQKYLIEVLQELSKRQKIKLLVLKDVFSEKEKHWATPSRFLAFKVQPNMQMPITWVSMDDYFASLKKSYRQNLQRTRKHKEAILVKNLEVEDLLFYENTLHELYCNVMQNSGFNTFKLPKDHFFKLKNQLKEQFRVIAYFKNDEMISFYSFFIQNKKLDSYFLGYNERYLKTEKLYLNMLLDMLEFGINEKCEDLFMGRTAMEIKSNIGLIPLDYFGFIHHKNTIINYFLPKLFRFFEPKVHWEQRHPFK